MHIIYAYPSSTDDTIVMYDGEAPDIRIPLSEISTFSTFPMTKEWSAADLISMLSRMPGQARDCTYRALRLRKDALNDTSMFSLSVIKYTSSVVNIAVEAYAKKDLIGVGAAVRMIIDALARIYIPAWAGELEAESIYKEHCQTGKFGCIGNDRLSDSYLRKRLRGIYPSFSLEAAYKSTSGAIHPSSHGVTRTDVDIGIDRPEQYGLPADVSSSKVICLDDSIRSKDAWTDPLRIVLIISFEIIFIASKWISQSKNPLIDEECHDREIVVVRLTNDDIDDAVSKDIISDAKHWDVSFFKEQS